jgi:hypothetical protein
VRAPRHLPAGHGSTISSGNSAETLAARPNRLPASPDFDRDVEHPSRHFEKVTLTAAFSFRHAGLDSAGACPVHKNHDARACWLDRHRRSHVRGCQLRALFEQGVIRPRRP